MKTKIKNIISIILIVLVVFILGVNIYSMYLTSKGDILPMPLGFNISFTETGSMEPNMPQNSLVFIIKDKTYEVNDIVAFRQEPNDKVCTVHRIVKIDGDTIITKGDANNGNDPAINKNDIKGRVLFHIPKIGLTLFKIKEFISRPLIKTIVFLVLIAAIVFSFIPVKNKKSSPTIDEIKAEIERLKQDTKQD